VVALDFASADAAIALGVTPVAMAKGGVPPWTVAALGDRRPELLDLAAAIPFEQIAALRPDVILATNGEAVREARADRARRRLRAG